MYIDKSEHDTLITKAKKDFSDQVERTAGSTPYSCQDVTKCPNFCPIVKSYVKETGADSKTCSSVNQINMCQLCESYRSTQTTSRQMTSLRKLTDAKSAANRVVTTSHSHSIRRHSVWNGSTSDRALLSRTFSVEDENSKE